MAEPFRQREKLALLERLGADQARVALAEAVAAEQQAGTLLATAEAEADRLHRAWEHAARAGRIGPEHLAGLGRALIDQDRVVEAAEQARVRCSGESSESRATLAHAQAREVAADELVAVERRTMEATRERHSVDAAADWATRRWSGR